MPQVANNSRNDKFVCTVIASETKQSTHYKKQSLFSSLQAKKQFINLHSSPSSLWGVKRRSNPQSTKSQCKNRKQKEFTAPFPLYHCERSEAIHKPLIFHLFTEKIKKFTNRIIMPYTEIATNLRFSQWQWGLSTLVSHTEIATAFSKPRNNKSKINEIATSSTNSRNDKFVYTVIARSKTTKQSINHWYFIYSQKK